MHRNRKFAWPVACALVIAGCSGTPETALSPTGVDAAATAVNPDGSTLKVTAPSDLGPRGVTVDSLRPTLTFSSATGRYAALAYEHELQIVDANDNQIYFRVLPAGASSHTLESDLTYSDSYWWRVRAHLGGQIGPWSNYAEFRTLDPPGPPPPPPGGELPFPVPAACGPGDPSNRIACAAAVAAVSAEWAACRGGRGVSCHRFTRQVVYALSRSDPNYKMIRAQPGGHACNCSGCGPSDGTMFREDTTVYGGNRVFDMIIGAGGPAPSLTWSSVPGPRPGDVPSDVPLCTP